MPKMRETDLKALLAAEKADALAGQSSSKLQEDRSKAMNYYLGDMSEDMPAADGRSKAVSTDVADTVEGLMPSLMEIFTGGDEVVQFEPVGKEDVPAAEQETDYVNHVFMQKNPGFLILYSFIKDALLSKVGVVKVISEEEESEEEETYLDQSEDQFMMLASKPDFEVVEHTNHDNGLHDVTIVCRKKYMVNRVEPVPPEEFGISRRARNIKDCGYCFHEVVKTESELVEQGYDSKQVKSLPSYTAVDSTEDSARDSVEESSGSGDDGLNTANRPLRVTEHYVKMDYEGNGKPRLYRVTTGGDDGVVLKRDGKADIVPQDMIPFAAMTPVIMTHRFFGRSIADLVMDIQRIKTALTRALMDNAYLANNPRVEVAEAHAGENTLDDLLISRPGGIVRTKTPGGLNWQTVPTIGNHIFPMLEYFDATREWRTGVTRQGQGIDANALQNQSATAVNQAFTAAQARMKLIARIFAETGIRDLFSLLHATIRKSGMEAETVKLRNQWVQVDPRQWKTRQDMTINVGLGSGGKQEKLGNLMVLVGLQKEAVAAGLTNLVQPKHLYNSTKEVTKLLEYKNPNQFFADPDEKDEQGQLVNPPPQTQQDPKLIEIQMNAQLAEKADQRKAQIETVQAQADMATQREKTQAEMVKDEREFQLKKELALLQAAIDKEQFEREEARKEREHQQQMTQNQQMHEQTMTQGQFNMAAGAQSHEQKMKEAKAKPKKKAAA